MIVQEHQKRTFEKLIETCEDLFEPIDIFLVSH